MKKALLSLIFCSAALAQLVPTGYIPPLSGVAMSPTGTWKWLQVDGSGNLVVSQLGALAQIGGPSGYIVPYAIVGYDSTGKAHYLQTDASGNLEIAGSGGGLTLATFASPPSSPTTNAPYLFTDTSSTGVCTGGGTATYAICAWNGSSWTATSTATGTGLGDPGANGLVYRNGAGTSIDATATQMSGPNFCSDAGANDTYACSLSPAIASLPPGTLYWFKANTANSAASGVSTINLNAKGAPV